MNIPVKILLLSLTAWLICGCSVLQQKPDRIDKIDLNEFLVTVNDMPDPSWTTNGSSDVVIDRERTTDYLFISYFSELPQKDICFGQDIYRYRSIRGAKRDIKYATRMFKPPYVPKEWTFLSEKASESYIGCDDYKCYWIARYDRIVIETRFWRTSDCSDSMDIADFQEVLKIIDQRASQLIYDE
jgi:hypothetical protein